MFSSVIKPWLWIRVNISKAKNLRSGSGSRINKTPGFVTLFFLYRLLPDLVLQSGLSEERLEGASGTIRVPYQMVYRTCIAANIEYFWTGQFGGQKCLSWPPRKTCRKRQLCVCPHTKNNITNY